MGVYNFVAFSYPDNVYQNASVNFLQNKMFPEATQRKLLIFIDHQRYLGLNDIVYSQDSKNYIVQANWSSYTSQLLALAIVGLSLYGTLSGQCVDNVEMISKPVKAFYLLHLLMAPIIQILLNFYLRMRQQTQQLLLQRLSQLAQRLQLDTQALPRPRWLYRFWLSSCTFYAVHISIFAVIYWNLCPQIEQIFFYMCFFLNFMRIFFVITCYTSLVSVVSSLLQAHSAQLILTVSRPSLEELGNSLSLYDQLLLLCHEEVVKVFGAALLLSFLNLGQNSIFVTYLATLENRFSYGEVVAIVSWMSVNILYMYMPLTINNLSVEVSITEYIWYKDETKIAI